MHWERILADRFNILALRRHPKMANGDSIYVPAQKKS